jgi:hypothetical protein
VASLEAKIREKVKAELSAPEPKPAPPIPDTLAAAQSARGSEAAYTPPTLDEILRR